MIREITIVEFNNFAMFHYLGNRWQTREYALILGERNYNYEFIGYFEEDKLMAASLICIKRIKFNTKYGYAPKGFLIDYTNQDLLKRFTRCLCNYYRKKNLAFIKINPEIVISEIDFHHDYEKKVFALNTNVISNLENLNYQHLKNNLNFEGQFPRFYAIKSLKDFGVDKVDKNVRNKVIKGERRGLKLTVGSRDDLELFYRFVKKKKDVPIKYYRDYYNTFSLSNSIDLFLVKMNTEEYLINSKMMYEEQLGINSELVEKIQLNNSDKLICAKMASDKALNTYKEEMIKASALLGKHNELVIGGALVLKYNNRISIFASGYDEQYKHLNPNHFMFYKIMDYYKDEYSIADLNGISGDFSNNSKYYGLNHFKFAFKPNIYELAGEFDLIIDPTKYFWLKDTNLLVREFNK